MYTFDLYNLKDDVLFISNNTFYEFVKGVCGEVEADILRVQGIRNTQCLIRSTNLLDILKLDCDEVNVIKPYACFRCNNGEFIVKQGVKLNLDNLVDALKEKHEKYREKNLLEHPQQQMLLVNSQITATNTHINENLITHDSKLGTLPTTITTGTTIDSSTTSPNSSIRSSNSPSFRYTYINDHILYIKDLIERFSRKTFISTILKHNEHYELLVTSEGETFKALIKCQCGTRLSLPMRSDRSKFVLSNFYAHITASTCSMANRIFQEERISVNKELRIQPTTLHVLSTPVINYNGNNSDSGRQDKRKHTDSSTTYSASDKSKKLKI